MKGFVLTIIIVALSVSACGIAVRPIPTSTTVLEEKTGKLTERNMGVELSVRLEDVEISPYISSGHTASFFVEITNFSTSSKKFDLDSFFLIDDRNTQYDPISPLDMIRRVSRDPSYLIPYPYVGYYYLEDKIIADINQDFSDPLPYGNINNPQDIFARALPVTNILPGKRVSGVVYFPVDLGSVKSFEIQAFSPDTPRDASPDFTFPFQVEK